MTRAVRRPTPAMSPSSRALARTSLWRRLFNAVWYAQQRQALRHIDRIVAARYGTINDALEREIEKRIFRTGWDPGR